MKRDYYSDSFFSFFFNPHELTKIVLKSSTKYYCTIWPSELNQKCFSCFPAQHTIPGETKGSPFNFFRHCETFRNNCFPPKGPLFIFFAVLRQNGCWKIPKGPPFQFFGIVRLFFWNFFLSKGSPLQFLWYFTTEWLCKNPEGLPLSVFFGIVRFFPNIKNFPPSIFWCFATEWMLNPSPPPFSFSALWDFFSLQRVPLQFLWYFTTDREFKNPKGSALSVFRHCETFFLNFFSLQRVPPSTETKMLTISKVSPF